MLPVEGGWSRAAGTDARPQIAATCPDAACQRCPSRAMAVSAAERNTLRSIRPRVTVCSLCVIRSLPPIAYDLVSYLLVLRPITELRGPMVRFAVLMAALLQSVVALKLSGTCGRRVAVSTAAAALTSAAATPAVAEGEDGSWAKHSGSFDDAFFEGFTTNKQGFAYKIMNDGVGAKPAPFQKVFVQYTGYLLDGTKFDSSYDKGKPFAFRLSKGKVITGWDAIAQSMPVGMKIIVKIPPEFAYGSNGAGPIPPNSPLIFYMEMVEFGNIKGDKPRIGGILS